MNHSANVFSSFPNTSSLSSSANPMESDFTKAISYIFKGYASSVKGNVDNITGLKRELLNRIHLSLADNVVFMVIIVLTNVPCSTL